MANLEGKGSSKEKTLQLAIERLDDQKSRLVNVNNRILSINKSVFTEEPPPESPVGKIEPSGYEQYLEFHINEITILIGNIEGELDKLESFV